MKRSAQLFAISAQGGQHMKSGNTSSAARIIRKLWITVPMLFLIGLVTLWPSSGLHAQGGHNITLNWSAPTTGGAPTSYNVKRGTVAGAETMLASVPVPTTTYVDSAGVGGTTYFYIVTAVNSGGESVPSNEVSAVFLATVPGAPLGLSAAAK